MTTEEIVARAIAAVPASRAPAAVVAALTEAGQLVPETTRVVTGDSGDDSDDVEERATASLRSWSERITGVSLRGDGIWSVEITGPSLLPEGCVAIDRARWERVRLAGQLTRSGDAGLALTVLQLGDLDPR